MQVLSAWYGHPSDPGRRLDVSERVKALLEGHEHLGSGRLGVEDGVRRCGRLGGLGSDWVGNSL